MSEYTPEQVEAFESAIRKIDAERGGRSYQEYHYTRVLTALSEPVNDNDSWTRAIQALFTLETYQANPESIAKIKNQTLTPEAIKRQWETINAKVEQYEGRKRGEFLLI